MDPTKKAVRRSEGRARSSGGGPISPLVTQQSRVKSTAGSVPGAYGHPHAPNSAAALCVGAIGSVAAARIGPAVAEFFFFLVRFLAGAVSISPELRLDIEVPLDRREARASGLGLEAAPGLFFCRHAGLLPPSAHAPPTAI